MPPKGRDARQPLLPRQEYQTPDEPMARCTHVGLPNFADGSPFGHHGDNLSDNRRYVLCSCLRIILAGYRLVASQKTGQNSLLWAHKRPCKQKNSPGCDEFTDFKTLPSVPHCIYYTQRYVLESKCAASIPKK